MGPVRRHLWILVSVLLLCAAAGIFIFQVLDPQRRVLVVSDHYWQRLFWSGHRDQLQIAVLNAGSRAEFARVSEVANVEVVLESVSDRHPRVLILSPLLSVHAEVLAGRLPNTQIVAWQPMGGPESESGGTEGDRPGNLTVLAPALSSAFFEAGKAEAEALRCDSGRIVHIYSGDGPAGSREMEQLRRGLETAGWRGRVERVQVPSEDGSAPDYTAIMTGESETDTAAASFVGVYSTKFAAEALEAAKSSGVPAAVLGPEWSRVYPETVRFSVELNIYPVLRRACREALRSGKVSSRLPVTGKIVRH
jgi:hypothetical protein